MSIADKLIKFNDESLPSSFVSIATKVHNGIPVHAAILIRHNTRDFLHHFPGATPPEVEEDFNEEGWYVYKIFDAIRVDDAGEVGAFLKHCQRICDRSDITYSFIIDGSSYDSSAEFASATGLPELGTCVGFCVNTLNEAIIDADSYFNLEDWDDSGIDGEALVWDHSSRRKVMNKYPDIDWELYDAYKKRITPLEYLCSAFVNNYPVSKLEIEELKPEVLDNVKLKFP